MIIKTLEEKKANPVTAKIPLGLWSEWFTHGLDERYINNTSKSLSEI